VIRLWLRLCACCVFCFALDCLCKSRIWFCLVLHVLRLFVVLVGGGCGDIRECDGGWGCVCALVVWCWWCFVWVDLWWCRRVLVYLNMRVGCICFWLGVGYWFVVYSVVLLVVWFCMLFNIICLSIPLVSKVLRWLAA